MKGEVKIVITTRSYVKETNCEILMPYVLKTQLKKNSVSSKTHYLCSLYLYRKFCSIDQFGPAKSPAHEANYRVYLWFLCVNSLFPLSPTSLCHCVKKPKARCN